MQRLRELKGNNLTIFFLHFLTISCFCFRYTRVPIKKLREAFGRSSNCVVYDTDEYRTSKLCFNCGYETKKCRLGDRWTRCLNPTCHVGDTNRDITEAEGIMTRGFLIHLDPSERIEGQPNFPPSLQYRSELHVLPVVPMSELNKKLQRLPEQEMVDSADEPIIISDSSSD